MFVEALQLLERQQKVTIPACLGWLTQKIYRYIDKYISNKGITPRGGGKSRREMWSAELKVL